MLNKPQKPHLKYFFCLAGVCLCAFALLRFPAVCAQGVRNGLHLCATVIIPALFPFMAVCEFVSLCGLSAKLGKCLTPVTRRLFGLQGNAGAAILMSGIGGYPVGARSADALLKSGQITTADARQLLFFCVNAGPAFVVSAVGAGMLGSPSAGWILLAAHLSASLLLGVLSGMARRGKRGKQTVQKDSPPPCAPSSAPPLADAFVEGVASSASAMFGICAFVILFSCLMAFLPFLPLNESVFKFLPGALETTAGCAVMVQNKVALPLLAALISWGGLCVHCQVFASCKAIRPHYPLFFLGRVMHTIFAFFLCALLLKIFPPSAATWSNSVTPVPQTGDSSIPASVALLVTCSMLLLSTSVKGVEKEGKL